VQETKAGAGCRIERGEVFPGGLEQRESADDVRVDERAGGVDRSVHVRFGGEVQHGIGPRIGEEPRHRICVGDVGPHERDARVLQCSFEIQQAAGVRQLVDDDDTI
jgi:hypothetical protein